MINEEWKKTQNDAPFVAFYDIRAVTFVLPDEMANVLIVGLQWFILIPRLNHTGSHRLIIPIPYPYLHRKKKPINQLIIQFVPMRSIHRRYLHNERA